MSKITKSLLKKIFPRTPASLRDRFVDPMNDILPKYDIVTKDRFAMFIGNVGVESDRLKALEEYASGAAYEGRCKGLGNCRKGDGVRYKGRSIMQTTGRYNYWKVVVTYLRVLTGKDWSKNKAGQEILLDNFDAYLKSPEYAALLKEADKYNVNFLANPELLEQFPHAVEAACVFVKDNGLNKYADAGNFYAYSGVINRGSPRKKALHYEIRKDIYELAMQVIPDDLDLSKSTRGVDVSPTLELPAGVPEVVDNVTVTSESAVEVSQTQVAQTGNGDTVSQTVETKNEQDVNQPAVVEDTKPYNEIGFVATLKQDLALVFGGNFGFEGLSQFLQHAAGIPEWLTGLLIWIGWGLIIAGAVWIVVRLISYVFYRFDGIKKREVETLVKTDTSRKDVEWK
jgi:predicted chitinase